MEKKIPTYFQYLDSMGAFESLPHQGYQWKKQYMERARELLAQAKGKLGGPRAHYPAIIQSETGDLYISYSYHQT